jgi:hypothetical protein
VKAGLRASRTRPFQICGFSRCLALKCASMSSRRACANGHDQGCTFKSSVATR